MARGPVRGRWRLLLAILASAGVPAAGASSCIPELVTFGRPGGASCRRPVERSQDCAPAAGRLAGVADGIQLHAEQSDEMRPSGCWYQPSNGLLFYNAPPAGAPATECSEAWACICCSATADSCAATELQASAVVAACVGASGSADVSVRSGAPARVLTLPAGTSGVAVEAASAALSLSDAESGECVVGSNCTFSSACAGAGDFCHSYKGMAIHYSGGRRIEISSATTRPVELVLRAASDARVEVQYRHGVVSPCPSPLPGCAACSSAPNCGSDEVPQCNGSAVAVCNSLASATVITSVSPSSVSAGVSTLLALQGAQPGTLRFAAHCGDGAAGTEAVPAQASRAYVLPSLGWYKLCYRAAGAAAFVEQRGLVVAAVAPTSASVLSGPVAPLRLTAGVRATISLQGAGAVGAGDLLSFARSCDTAAPSIDPPDGDASYATVSFAEAGTYDLCYRSRGGSDSVAQTGASVQVQEPRTVPMDACPLQLVDYGFAFGDACLQPVQSVEDCSALAGSALGIPASAGPAIRQFEANRPYGCWFQRSATGAQLYFNMWPRAGQTPVACSGGWLCVCCNERATTSTSTTLTTTTRITTSLPMSECNPRVVTSGAPFGDTCLWPALSVAQCGIMAAAVLSAPSPATPNDNRASDRPYGCWLEGGVTGQLWFNPERSGTSCSQEWSCICCENPATTTLTTTTSTTRTTTTLSTTTATTTSTTRSSTTTSTSTTRTRTTTTTTTSTRTTTTTTTSPTTTSTSMTTTTTSTTTSTTNTTTTTTTTSTTTSATRTTTTITLTTTTWTTTTTSSTATTTTTSKTTTATTTSSATSTTRTTTTITTTTTVALEDVVADAVASAASGGGAAAVLVAVALLRGSILERGIVSRSAATTLADFASRLRASVDPSAEVTAGLQALAWDIARASLAVGSGDIGSLQQRIHVARLPLGTVGGDAVAGNTSIAVALLEALSAPARRLGSAGPRGLQGCGALDVLQSTWLRSNPYLWAAAPDDGESVAANATVKALRLEQCGEVLPDAAGGGNCSLAFSLEEAGSPLEGSSAPLCLLFDDVAGAWSFEGVKTEDLDGVVRCRPTSSCSASLAVVFRSIAMMGQQGERGASAAMIGVVVGLTSATALVCGCIATAVLRRRRKAGVQLERLSPIVPEVDKACTDNFVKISVEAGVAATKRAALVERLFRALDVGGKGTLQAREVQPFASLVGFDGVEYDWSAEFDHLCRHLGVQSERGLDAAAFAALLSDASPEGCYCTMGELEVLLLRLGVGIAEPEPDAEPRTQSTLEFMEQRAAEARRLRRERLVQEVFRRLNASGSGSLSSAELRPVADHVGFAGTSAEWDAEFSRLCRDLGCDPALGLGPDAFARLVADRSGAGCYVTSADLRLLLRQAAGETAPEDVMLQEPRCEERRKEDVFML